MPRNQPSHLGREAAATDSAKTDDLQIEQELAGTNLDRRMWRRSCAAGPVRGRVAAVVRSRRSWSAWCSCAPGSFATPSTGPRSRARGWASVPRIVLPMAAGLTVCWVARFALAAVSQYLAGTAALAVLEALRARVFAHVQGAVASATSIGPGPGGSSPASTATSRASSRC